MQFVADFTGRDDFAAYIDSHRHDATEVLGPVADGVLSLQIERTDGQECPTR